MSAPDLSPYTIDDIAPRVPAEQVPLEALLATRSTTIPVDYVTSLIEEAIITSDPSVLDTAQQEINNAKHDLLLYPKLELIEALMPGYHARVEHRPLTEEEMELSIARTLALLKYQRWVLAKDDRALAAYLGRPEETGPLLRRTPQGDAGEAIFVFGANMNALDKLGPFVLLSSGREEKPRGKAMVTKYGNDIHDAHTYNPDDPDDRVTFSVKTRRSISGTQSRFTADTVNILQIGSFCKNAVKGLAQKGSPPQPTIVGILDWAIASASPSSNNELAIRTGDFLISQIGRIVNRTDYEL